MKEKAIIFIVGLLLGAIISTSSIYVFSLTNNTNNNSQELPTSERGMRNDDFGQRDGNRPDMPQENFRQNGI